MRYLPFIALVVILSTGCQPKTLPLTESDENEVIVAIDDKAGLDSLKNEIYSDTLASTPLPDTILWYSRSGCFGTCPAYNFILFDNKMLKYTGHRFAHPQGKHDIALSDELYSRFFDLIQVANLSLYDENYPAREDEWIVDLPTSTLMWYNESGEPNIIRNNHSAPESLNTFEKQLAELLKGLDWKKEDE